MQAMIFAAGLGTRLRPLADTVPKALVRVGGVTLLEHTIRRLTGAGAGRIVVNVHHFAGMIRDFLGEAGNFGADVAVSDESGCLLDTGGGLRHARGLFRDGEPILIHNVDILSNVDLGALCARGGGDTAAVLLVSSRPTSRYLLFGDDMRLMGWTNVATGEVRSPYPPAALAGCRRLAFSGIHLFSPCLFAEMEDFPDKFGIIDFYIKVCAKVRIEGWLQDGLRIMDVGKTDTLAEASRFLEDIGGGASPAAL